MESTRSSFHPSYDRLEPIATQETKFLVAEENPP